MRIQVKVIPNSKQNSVEKKEETYIVRTTAKPIDNKANAAVISLLAKHFKTAKSNLQIVRGIRLKNKVVDVVNKNFN
ncbi:DUF167 domain-containing protein [Patescibacteria group bacterium]|nr:DUF167 domain-containing protein [Patescibacteria group bacterium]